MRKAMAGMVLAIASPAAAQGTQPFIECAGVADDAQRLACYDRAAENISADARRLAAERQERAGAAAAAAAAARAEAERDRFGREGVRALRGSDSDPVREVKASVTEALRDQLGKMVFLLDNGQMWRQVDGFSMPSVRPGAAVTIARGAMGSYRIRLDGTNRTAQVVRMR